MITETSFLYKLVYRSFEACYYFQSFAATIFHFIFIQPALLIIRLISFLSHSKNQGRQRSTQSFAIIDSLIWYERYIWNYLCFMFKINSYISGVRHWFNLYEHLLTWNSKIPLIALEDNKAKFTFEILYRKNDDGSRNINLVWLSTHKRSGEFKICERQTSSSTSHIEIKSVWISGNQRGKAFSALHNNISSLPFDRVYHPPKWLISTTEIIISASAILALFQITKTLWDFLVPFQQEAFSFFAELISEIEHFIYILLY